MTTPNPIAGVTPSASSIPTSRSPGCIVYLVRNTPLDRANFIRSLTVLRTHYLSKYPCPVFAYHEDLSVFDVDDIQKKSKVQVEFRQVTFPPKGLGLDKAKLGYRHMCHFFANDVFYLKELAGFEYYMRLDTDSFIMSDVPCDLFQRMKDYDYAYIALLVDNPAYTHGLWPAARAFIQAHPELKTYRTIESIPVGTCFYTNFEICRLDWFRAPPYVDFFAHLDKLNGIYTTRWGDHTIRYLGVSLFTPPERIYQVRDMHYYHQRDFKPKA